ncbi:hypothetical protein [Campylobacter sp.]|uniref:hypothetical protein n=1 Tax=Campylobacter sp. TaxID=205 RepID=UPI002A3CA636|nr:hypothetical protein [Campylobacter sp.]MDD6924811.1 hypothetical protein [Campylobacteraceae bacterium]MDD7090520.1 hypothetical protein [Campylobacteraceae bacterium]
MQFNDFDINSPVIRHIYSLNAEIERLRAIEQKYNKIKNFFPVKVALKIRKLLLKLMGRI